LCCLPPVAAAEVCNGITGSDKRREFVAAGSESSASNSIRRTTLELPLSASAAAHRKISTFFMSIN